MAHSFLIFDFGANEEAAQQARHKIEGWKQAFRLGDKLLMKFEREEGAVPDAKAESDAKAKSGAKTAKPAKSASAAQAESGATNGRIRVLIRLDFSDHEKLSHQRWFDRIPSEEPFKSAKSETVRQGDVAFAKTAEHFDTLD
jgi:hypothetical protein